MPAHYTQHLLVKMAYDLLKPGGTLVSVFPENRLYYKDNESVKFQKWLKENKAYVEDVPYGSFQEVGTMVDTVLVNYPPLTTIVAEVGASE